MESYLHMLASSTAVQHLSIDGLLYLHFLIKCRPFGQEGLPLSAQDLESSNLSFPPDHELGSIKSLFLSSRGNYPLTQNLLDQILNSLVVAHCKK